jgi:mannose-6-phosphate isomerase-like protein (cupin superfamily)
MEVVSWTFQSQRELNMLARVYRWIFPVVLVGAGFGMALLTRLPSDAASPAPQPLKSQVVRWEDARSRVADWGEMRLYFTGETADTNNALVAVAVVEPGKAVHRAHRHAPEEYLLVVEGSGTWSLDGKEFPAERGDILYVEPWVYHGLTNTGDVPLIFAVVRYNSKGVEVPPRPDDRPDEL